MFHYCISSMDRKAFIFNKKLRRYEYLENLGLKKYQVIDLIETYKLRMILAINQSKKKHGFLNRFRHHAQVLQLDKIDSKVQVPLIIITFLKTVCSS